jgi:Divergent InlB B-repeat domain
VRTAALPTLVTGLLLLACAGAWAAQPIRDYPDTVGDNPGGLAQDITSVRISIDASQVITTRVNTSRPSAPNLQAQDYILIFLDTDPNSLGEGSGPDFRISVSGGSGTTAALLERWVGVPGAGGHWETYTPGSFSGQFAPGGLEARFSRADLGIGNAFRFHALTRWNGQAQYDDWFPNDTQARETFDVVAPVTVSKAGLGKGTVRSSPTGIDCGPTCMTSMANFSLAATVTLQAEPDAASDFAGWSGACDHTAIVCTITVDDAKSVTARFVPGTEELTVSTSGRGRVKSKPRGISCGSACQTVFPRGSVVSLTADPALGARFVRWIGCPRRPLKCKVRMNGKRTVRAIFKQYPRISLGWKWNRTGSGFRLIGLPDPSAAVSFRCLKSCAIVGRGRNSADLALGAGGVVEMRATKRGSVGASRLITERGGDLASPKQKCLPPGQRRPVQCRLLDA